MNTPAQGFPAWIAGHVKELRDELRTHSNKDEQALAQTNRELSALQLETGKQTIMIANIERGLQRAQIIDDKRATTEIEVAGATRKAWRKASITGAVGLVFTALGWLLHHVIG